jgi:hypothetical protein
MAIFLKGEIIEISQMKQLHICWIYALSVSSGETSFIIYRRYFMLSWISLSWDVSDLWVFVIPFSECKGKVVGGEVFFFFPLELGICT